MTPFSRTASGSLLLPVLVVLSLAYEARSFSHTVMDLRMKPLSSVSLSRPCNLKRRLAVSRRLGQLQGLNERKTICWATLEPPSLSATTNEEDDDNDHAALNSGPAAVEPEDQQHEQQYNNHNRHQWQGRKKPKHVNAAMADTAFLRKRTEKFLALPSIPPLAADEPTISSRGMKVDRKTFHFLIDAWAFSGEEDAAEQASALLHKMEDLYQGQQHANHHPAHNIQPDVRSYTKVINAIARTASPRSGEMAEEILDKMINLYQSGQNLQVKPNTFTYTAVVEAHANSGIPGSAQAAEEICEVMVRKFVNGEDPDVRPTSRSYNAAINAYAKSGDIGAAERADDLFRRMEDVYRSTGLEEVKPNSYNYNSLISAWANCREEGAAHRAEEVLDRMEALYKGGDKEVKPTTVTYNAVMDAYSKCAEQGEEETAAGERAENLLYHMKRLYESGENVDAKPNVRSYNTVINVWYVND